MATHVGTYTWHIDDVNLVNKILNAKWKDRFDSNVFEIGKLNWKIELRPNGYSEKTKGFCGVFLRLLAMPSSWKSIFFQFHIECPQIQSKMMRAYSYNKPKIMGLFISSFKELKECKTKELTFIMKIRMIRISLKKDNKILYEMKRNKYKKNIKFEWKINKEMMNKVKLYERGKGICSDIYNDIWCLQLYPNGHWNSKDGDVFIELMLCCLPSNVSKLKAQWTIQCHQANIKQTCANEFHEDNTYWGWNNNTLSFNEFRQYNRITLSVEVIVFNEYDLNGYDLNGKYITMEQTQNAWNEYKEPQNDDEKRFVPFSDIDLNEKLQIYDVSIQSLSTNMEQMNNQFKSIQNTLNSISKTMSHLTERVQRCDGSIQSFAVNNEQIENRFNSLSLKIEKLADNVLNFEEKKEEDNANEMRKEISFLQKQMNQLLCANSQQNQRVNPHHERVREWLKQSVNLEIYYDLFIENGFEDLDSIKTINMNVLNMMGIDKIGHKMKILRCVVQLNDNEGDTAYI